MKIDKKHFKDVGGRMLTQGLFLELGYKSTAVFTLDDQDKEYNGKTYPSLKRIYLEHEDVTEYDFATTHLLGWKHWQRICKNKVLGEHVAEWREELELKIRSQAIHDIIATSAEDKGFQAAKWLAEKGWVKKGAGRPTKDTAEHDARMEQRLNDEFGEDLDRLNELGVH